MVAVPCNQFGIQEPGSDAEIPFCYQHVRPGAGFIHTFDLAAKNEVNGVDQDPLYTFLKASCPPPKELMGLAEDYFWDPIRTTDITWNFEKFLVDTNGQLIKRYEPAVDPNNIRDDIDAVLAAAQPIAVRKPIRNRTRKHKV